MYTDLLIQIKNAQQAKKEFIRIPFSTNDMTIAELLAANGYVEHAVKKGRLPKRIIEIKMKYKDGKGMISTVKLVSKPSRRLYAGYRELSRVRHGYGMGVISTPQGIMTTREAKQKKVGGEILFEIW